VTRAQKRVLLFLDGNAPATSRAILASTGLQNAPALDRLREAGLVQCSPTGLWTLTDTGWDAVAELRQSV
jgi:hypothetical protein